jgi:hypothetical protein
MRLNERAGFVVLKTCLSLGLQFRMIVSVKHLSALIMTALLSFETPWNIYLPKDMASHLTRLEWAATPLWWFSLSLSHTDKHKQCSLYKCVILPEFCRVVMYFRLPHCNAISCFNCHSSLKTCLVSLSDMIVLQVELIVTATKCSYISSIRRAVWCCEGQALFICV